MKDKTLKGYPPDIIALNYWLYGCADPDCPPISAGKRKELWEDIMPKIEGLGRIEVFSAAGENGRWFYETFKDGDEK